MARAGPRKSLTEAESLDDAQLVKQWQGGDGMAAEVLIRRYQKTVYFLMLRSTGDAAAADDLTQKAFLKALSAASSLRGEGAFRPWLMRIALNLSKSRGRGLLRWKRAPEQVMEHLHSTKPAADAALIREQQMARVREAIHKLPKRQRQIVQMRLHAELPFKQIAEVVGTSEASAKVTYHNAVRSLRQRLGEST